MRAYSAILKDSFRESLRSRVLWMVLIAITLLLLLVIPLSIQQKSSWRLAGQDVPNGRELATLFVEQAASEEKPHITHFWMTLEEDTRERWQKNYAPTDGSRRRGHSNSVVEELNHLLEQKDLYDAESWRGQPLPTEITELIEKRARGESIDTLELNRRLLEDAFPGYIAASGGASFFLSYLAWEMPMPIATTHNQLQMIANLTISTFISLVVGVAGVFIAILVTASMVPNTFASGSIDLLLSKPIGRSSLYLTKFLGGCTFILLNAAYFLVGFWLITGLRLGIWTNRVLWCIPVFLFLFAIYYSVSALAGVVWRNTIICVVVSFLFWLLCFIVGNARESIEVFFLRPTRLQSLVPAGEKLLATNTAGGIVIWDEASGGWRPVIEDASPSGGPPFQNNSSGILGMVYDAPSQRIVAIQRSKDHLVIGDVQDGFVRRQGTAIPLGAKHLYSHDDGSLTIVCTHGIFRIDGDYETEEKPSEPLKIAGFSLPIRKSRHFQSIGPTGWDGMGINFSVARSPTSTSLAVHDRGNVFVLDQGDDGVYARRFEVILEGDKDAELGFTSKTLVVARHDGLIRLVDMNSQSLVAEFEPFPDEKAKQVIASPDGRWLVILFTGGTAALIDSERQTLAKRRMPSQGKITTAAFAGDEDRLLIADQRLRVTAWSIGDNRRDSLHVPKSTTFESVYYWIINPMYKVFPKPAELSKLVQYLLLKDSLGSGGFGRELGLEMTRSDVWNPIWSNLAFVAIVLFIGCVYVSRKEF